jgi:hypothetical protein
MVVCKALFTNQWPFNWFKMQVVTIGDKMYTMICDICHVRGGGTWCIAQGWVFML